MLQSDESRENPQQMFTLEFHGVPIIYKIYMNGASWYFQLQSKVHYFYLRVIFFHSLPFCEKGNSGKICSTLPWQY